MASRTRRVLLRAALLLAASALAACAGTAKLVPEGGYRAELGREHPLLGAIWAPTGGRALRVSELLELVSGARFIAIGENHEHPDHHRVQAWLLDQWLPAQRAPAVAFEMLDGAQAPALKPPARTPEELAARVRWSDSGWPAFALYEPIFDVALARGASVIAAHPPREQVRKSMEGSAPEEAAALRLDQPLPAPELASLEREIRDSHCGHAPAEMVNAMVRAQSFKDAWMAREIVQAGRPVALIAGNGHVGEARGVPQFLRRHGVADVLTIALVEVLDGRHEPAAYALPPVDVVIFTARMSDDDPCEVFRAQLEKMRARSAPPSAR